MSKKYLIVTLILVVVGVAGGFNAYNQSQTPQASDVALANIEALAGDGPSGEGGSSSSWQCWSQAGRGQGFWRCGNPCEWIDGKGGKDEPGECVGN